MIKYYGTPITGNDVIMSMKGSDFLVSYYYPQQMNIVPHIANTYILDNGAYSAHQNGESIDWVGYAEWVQENTFANCNFHIIPDVIGGSEKDNIKLIDSWPLRSGWPVFHMEDSIDMLKDLISGFPNIAIGGSCGIFSLGSSAWWSKMSEIMDIVCDDEGRPSVKIHGLMMLNPAYRSIPLYSADTATLGRNLSVPGMSRKTAALIRKDETESCKDAIVWDRSGATIQENLF